MSEGGTPTHAAVEQPERLAQPVDAELPPRLPFPVVGVGVSLGRLEAFTEFLDALRPGAGMDFVLAQHLPPNREGLTAEVLARRTACQSARPRTACASSRTTSTSFAPGHVLTVRDGRFPPGLAPLHLPGRQPPGGRVLSLNGVNVRRSPGARCNSVQAATARGGRWAGLLKRCTGNGTEGSGFLTRGTRAGPRSVSGTLGGK